MGRTNSSNMGAFQCHFRFDQLFQAPGSTMLFVTLVFLSSSNTSSNCWSLADDDFLSSTFFEDVHHASVSEKFQLTKAFNEDRTRQKVNLNVDVYLTDEGKMWVLPVVKTASLQLANTLEEELGTPWLENHSAAGDPDFRSAAIELLLGTGHAVVKHRLAGGVQARGRNGGFRLAAEFLKRHFNSNVVYVSTPTWDNHKTIFKEAGFSDIREYRYWNPNTCKVDIDGLLKDLENAPEKSIVILHAVAHEPTGVDLTRDQWSNVADIVKRRQLLPVFDCSYQGFATGNLDADAWAVRYFAHQNLELFVVQSFSTSFGSYGEGVGRLCVVAKRSSVVPKVLSQLETLASTMWSISSDHDTRIVSFILNNKAFLEDWKFSLETMPGRMASMRTALAAGLVKKNATGHCDYGQSYIPRQVGLFSLTGLTVEQSKAMVDKHHVYMLKSGRISIAGLTTKNVDYVVDAMVDVLTTLPDPRLKA